MNRLSVLIIHFIKLFRGSEYGFNQKANITTKQIQIITLLLISSCLNHIGNKINIGLGSLKKRKLRVIIKIINRPNTGFM